MKGQLKALVVEAAQVAHVAFDRRQLETITRGDLAVELELRRS